MTSLPLIKLPYTIRVDKAFHDDPKPTIYDIQVMVDDPLKAVLEAYVKDPMYAQNLREISNSKSKHAFFEGLAKNPTDFIVKWLSSQKRDLEVIGGEAARGGGEDASGDEWRKGGADGIWGSENVRESVNLIVGTARPKV